MASPAPIQTSANPTDTFVGYLLFGNALKMGALRHVLRTLEFLVLDPEDAKGGLWRLRIAFDGCDSEACAAKAGFMRSFGAIQPSAELFPIAQVPQLASLLDPKPIFRKHQGSIFDPEVKEFKDRWGAPLHTLMHFFKDSGDSNEQLKWLSNYSEFDGAKKLEKLAVFTSGIDEEAVLRGFIEAVRSLELRLTEWSKLARGGKYALLASRLESWNRLRAMNSSIRTFEEAVVGLESSRDFKTTVCSVGDMPVSALAEWKTQLDQLL